MSRTDPTLVGDCTRSRKWVRLAAERGLSLQRVSDNSRAVRLTGPGIFVIAAELRLLVDADFELPRIKAEHL